jgi:hypothetical protein
LGAPIVIDVPVAHELARLRVTLKAIGRAMRVVDAWIAVIAIVDQAAVCTQDADSTQRRKRTHLSSTRVAERDCNRQMSFTISLSGLRQERACFGRLSYGDLMEPVRENMW